MHSFFHLLFSPVPIYNWTRRGAPLPRNSYLTSYSRVLIIPKVQVEDQGEYVCRASNERSSIENSVILNIQGTTTTTIISFILIININIFLA